MARADFVHNTQIATHSFTYNADRSSAIFRFMNTFVRLIEAWDGFLPTLCSEYWQGCQTLMNPWGLEEHHVETQCQWDRVRERERSSTGASELSTGERGSEECVSYSLLEARAPLRQSHCLDWRRKQSPWLKSMLAFTRPCNRKHSRSWQRQPL